MQLMFRRFTILFNISRCFKIFSKCFVLNLLMLINRSRWLIIIYFLLIFLSLSVLLYHQSYEKIRFNSVPLNSSVDNNDDQFIQCRFPQLSLNINNSFLYESQKPIQPICRSWFHPIVIYNYHVRLVIPQLDCRAIFYIGEGDGKYEPVSKHLIYNKDVPILSDCFTVKCEDDIKENKTTNKNNSYPALPYLSIHYNRNAHERLENISREDDNYDVLVLGLDSVSRLQFQRMLPKTYKYITQSLDAVVLKGYNILGDGTPQQLIPMLTGYKETELPSTLQRDRNGSFVDIYPFIWNKYRENGYVTGYAEDRIEYGIWRLRLKGFNKTPTDHYLSPFYEMETTKSLLYKYDAHCIRNETSFDIFLSYIKQFWLSYARKKKFFFGFFKQYTHDGYDAGSLLDDSLREFFKAMNQTNDYKKTIVILMTDHGARFTKARQTPQGKLEERLPFMSFIFPKDFQIKYQSQIEILKENVLRLTTPFDIHSTLLSLININKYYSPKTNSPKQRNISLFNLVPAKRTCDDLQLEPHWCSCLQWNNVDINDMIIKRAVQYIINSINNHLDTVENSLCYKLQYDSIYYAQIYQPNKELLRFSHSSDMDGRIPQYNDRQTDITFYQVTFTTTPNKAIYEATTQYSSKSGDFSIDLSQISRLNAYKTSASCIEKSYSHLRKFCYCLK